MDDQNINLIIARWLNDAVKARVVQSGSRHRINYYCCNGNILNTL